MHPSITFLYAATAILVPSVSASPVDTNVAVKRAAPDADVPDWCKPPGITQQYNAMYFIDESSTCSFQGVATHCCLTVLTGGGCSVDSTSDVSDLQNLLGQQIQKDWHESTTVGKYEAYYNDLLWDKLSPNILPEWFAAMGGPSDFAKQGKSITFDQMYFQAQGDGFATSVNVDCA